MSAVMLLAACKPGVKEKPHALTDGTVVSAATAGTLPAVNTGHATGSSMTYNPGGHVEGVQGFEQYGTDQTYSGASHVSVKNAPENGGTVSVEIAVDEGKVRAYLADKAKGFIVRPSDISYRYVEATPGQPAKFTGEMVLMGGEYGFVLETVGAQAKGVHWRIWQAQ